MRSSRVFRINWGVLGTTRRSKPSLSPRTMPVLVPLIYELRFCKSEAREVAGVSWPFKKKKKNFGQWMIAGDKAYNCSCVSHWPDLRYSHSKVNSNSHNTKTAFAQILNGPVEIYMFLDKQCAIMKVITVQ